MMQVLKNHLTEIFSNSHSTAFDSPDLDSLLDDMKEAINNHQKRLAIGLHVLTLVSSSLKASVHSQKALNAAMHIPGGNEHG